MILSCISHPSLYVSRHSATDADSRTDTTMRGYMIFKFFFYRRGHGDSMTKTAQWSSENMKLYFETIMFGKSIHSIGNLQKMVLGF